MNFDVPYAITCRLPGATIASARERVTGALKVEGFGILTEIDVQATLEEKLGVKTQPYVILGACNPKLAHEALDKAPSIGLLLPCNVVVAQDGADVVVSAASPRAMFEIAKGVDGVAEVAAAAEERLRRAINSLSA